MTKKNMNQNTKKRKRMKQMDQFMIMKKQMVNGEKIATISTPRLPLHRQEKGDVFIPEEVILQILVKLPARSVGRFRCVCKSWLSATTGIPFIRFHTEHNRATCQSLIIYLAKSRKKYSLASIDANADSGITLRQLPGRKHKILASCDGLLCLRTVDGHFIVNPLTSYSIKLRRQGTKLHRIFGFYFHHSTSKYRVLRVLDNIQIETFVSVVGEKSMRLISSCRPATGHHGFLELKGSLYWLAFTQEIVGQQPDTITTFDTESEVYSLLSPPPSENRRNIGGSLVDFNGELGLWVMSIDNIIDVWIMEESWVKRYSFNYIDVKTDGLGVPPPQEEAHWSLGAAGVVRDEELFIDLLVSATHDHLIRCNLKTGVCCYQQSEISHKWLSKSFPYMEALTYPDCSFM